MGTNRLSVYLVFIFSFLIAGGQAPLPPSDIPAGPPKTQVEEVRETIQGVEVVDPYRWLEDQNSPQTRAWIDAQNAYTDALLARIPGRESLRQTVGGFLKIETMTTPVVRNGRYFFMRRQADQDQALLYMRRGLEAKDEVLVDPLALSPEHTITIGALALSRDGSLLA